MENIIVPVWDNLTLTKTGSAEIVFKGVKFQRAIDYGVLNGTRNTDYEWLNDGCHAVGYDVTIEELDTTSLTYNGTPLTFNGIPLTI